MIFYQSQQQINMDSLSPQQEKDIQALLDQHGIKNAKEVIESNGKRQNKWLEFINKRIAPVKKKSFKERLLKILQLKDTKRKVGPIVLAYDQIEPIRNAEKIVIQRLSINQYANIQIINTQIQSQTQKRIINSLQKIESLQEYLKIQINHIVGFLQRRCSLIKYFKILQKIIAQLKIKTPLTILLSSMTITDFFILVLRYMQYNDVFAFLLSKQIAPIPIAFKTKDKTVYDIKSCQSFLGTEEYSLIINIRSQKSQTPFRGPQEEIIQRKSKIFRQQMKIDEQYFQKSNFQSSINLYKIPCIQGKKVLMIDFISYKNRDKQEGMDFEDHEKIKRDLVTKLKQKVSLFIFHFSEEEIVEKDMRIITQYQDVFSLEAKRIAFIQQLYFQSQQAVQENLPNFFDNKFIYVNGADANILFPTYLTDTLKFDTKKITSLDLELQQEILMNIQQFFAKKQKIDNFIADNLDKPRVQLFPKSILQEQLNKIRIKIKSLNIIQYENLINSYKKQELRIKNSLKQKTLSPFIDGCREFINSSQKQFQYFVQAILKNTNDKIDPLQLQVKTNQNQLKNTSQKEDIYKKIDELKNKIHQKRITIDSIIHQLSIYNELIIDRNSQKPNSSQQQIINNYYEKCINNLYPFNILNGENSTFGCESLERFFKQLNDKYKRSNIFVVSVIGAKSSGKSTLINHLFGYNFYMREDKYAKGIFVGLCQIGDKILVVLDSQGIMSVDVTDQKSIIDSKKLGQYATFDHQIASLIMQQSDLVIITGFNKNPLDKTISKQLQLTVGICYKVLDAISINNHIHTKKYFVPRKILFALSNQKDNNNKIKDVVLKDLIMNLRLILVPDLDIKNQPTQPNDEYINKFQQILEKYIRLQARDIFLLPDMFKYFGEKKLRIESQDYGVSVLGLRNRILDYLSESSQHRLNNKNMNEIYGDAQVYWETLLLTAKNIVQYKSINESSQKSMLYYKYKQKYQSIYNKIQSLLKDKFKPQQLKLKVEQIQRFLMNPPEDKKISKYTDTWSFFNEYSLAAFLQIFQSKYKNSIIDQSFNIFSKQAQIISTHQQWINQYKTNIQRIYESILTGLLHQQYNEFDKSLKKAVLNNFTTQLDLTLSTLIIQNRDNAQNLQKQYFIKAQQLVQKGLIFKNNPSQTQANLVRNFKIILQSQQIFLKELQIKHIKDCLDYDNKIQNKYIYNLHQFIQFEDQSQVQQKDRANIANLIKESVQSFKVFIQKAFTTKIIQLEKDLSKQQASQKLKKQDQSMKKVITNLIVKQLFPYFKNQGINVLTKQLQIKLQSLSTQIYKGKQIKQRSKILLERLGGMIITIQDSITQIKQVKQIGQLQREKQYLHILINKCQNLQTERIALRVINFKIILLSNLFKVLLELINDQNDENIKKQQKQFDIIIQQKKKYLSKKFQDYNEQKLKQATADDLDMYKKQLAKLYKDKFEQFWREFSNTKVNSQHVRHLRNAMNTTIDKTVQSTQQSSEQQRKQAKEHYIKCYKFIKRPQKFILETVIKEIVHTTNVQQKLDKSINFIRQDIQNFKRILKNQTQANIQTILQLKSFTKSLSIKKNIKSVKISSVTNAILTILQKEQQKMFSFIYQSYQPKKPQQYAKGYILGLKQQIIGCEQCCPMCGAKCLKAKYHGDQHQALSHKILAFGGCRFQWTGQFIIQNCLTLSVTKNTWFINRQSGYKNCLLMIKANYSNWSNDLPMIDKQHSFYPKEEVPLSLKVTWANIQDAMIDAFQVIYKQKVFKSSDSQVVKEKLNENYLSLEDLHIVEKSIISGKQELLKDY